MSWSRQEGLSLQAQLRTQAIIEKNATKLADECIAQARGHGQILGHVPSGLQLDTRATGTR
jgi:hypothetical protein